MKKVAVFPGSFDPFTKGHQAIVEKSLGLFDELIIAIGVNSTKSPYFPLENRIMHIKSQIPAGPSISIVTYEKLTVELCKDLGANYIVRGLRDSKDFEYEKAIAQMNLTMSGIETVFFLTNPEYAAINSTIVREVHKNKGDITHFVTNAHLLV